MQLLASRQPAKTKYSKEELLKLIGQLAGHGSDYAKVQIIYNANRLYNLFGEYEGTDKNDWGYAVSTKILGEGIEVTAQGKELEDALWNLAQEIPKVLKETHERRKRNIETMMEKIQEFLDRNNPKPQSTSTPYRD